MLEAAYYIITDVISSLFGKIVDTMYGKSE